MTKDTARLNAFPVFMRVEGEAVVIVGDGDEALAKARLLGQSSARLRIVSEAPSRTSLPGSPPMAPSTSRRPTIRRISPARCWCLPRPATRRWIAGFPTTPARKTFPSTQSIGRNSAISSRRRWSTARRSPSPSAPKARDPFWRRSCAQRSTGCCRLRLARLPALANSLRDAAERLLPKGNRAPPLLERFLHRRAGPRHGNRPCLGGSSGCHRTARCATRRPKAISRWSAPVRARKIF